MFLQNLLFTYSIFYNSVQHRRVHNLFHEAVNFCDGLASVLGELIARREHWWQLRTGNSKYTDKY